MAVLGDLLFALHGFPGDIFQLRSTDGVDHRLELAALSTPDLFHPAELQILADLCAVGSDFRFLDAFCRENG